MTSCIRKTFVDGPSQKLLDQLFKPPKDETQSEKNELDRKKEFIRPDVEKVMKIWYPFSQLMGVALVIGVAFAIRGAVVHNTAFKIAGGALVGGSILVNLVGNCQMNRYVTRLSKQIEPIEMY